MAAFNINAFMSQQDQLKQINIDLLIPYHNHKFKIYTGERLDDMVNSIKENGVLTPIIVRPAPNNNGKYEILAGHNRCNAAARAGLTAIPGIIKEGLSDSDAEMYVIETNLIQRGFNDLSISEQAAVIAMRHSQMFDASKREAIAQELHELEAPDKSVDRSKLALAGEEYGLSRNSVARLVRINTLLEKCDKFTIAVDNKDLSVRAAVELSYISPTALNVIFDNYYSTKVIDNLWCDTINISMSTAIWLCEVFTNFDGSKADAERLFETEHIKKTQKNIDRITAKPIKISISAETFRKYFDEKTKPDDAADIIDKALKLYFSQNNDC